MGLFVTHNAIAVCFDYYVQIVMLKENPTNMYI